MPKKNDFDRLPPECDSLCKYRKCLHKGYDKGSFSPGVGYGEYREEPIYCCLTRLDSGCPGTFNASGKYILSQPDWRKFLADVDIEKMKVSAKGRRKMAELKAAIEYLIDRQEIVI